MALIEITEEFELSFKRWKHEYVCKCCGDEFYNILDKGSIRATGFCCYCRDKRLEGIRCDCKKMTNEVTDKK